MPVRPGSALVLLLLAAPSSAAITGVCPDGSIFVVQTTDAIPCQNAKRVDPSDVPPIQPEFLPRPYGWERWNRHADPNNPYNLVDTAPMAESAAVPDPAAPPAPGVSAPPAPEPTDVAAIAPPRRALDLALTARDLADLDELVALSQEVVPATVSQYSPDGDRRASLQLAVSTAFEQRMHAALASQAGGQRGPVVLFRAEARAPSPFHGNLTFVQGHVAFHPDPANPDQFGILDGALGDLAGGERVLGYAVLPEHLDPSQPLDVYWDDRRITATLRP